jgi:outer membrane protein TolC
MFALACQAAGLLGLAGQAAAAPLPGTELPPPLPLTAPAPAALTLEQALHAALTNNPHLATVRQQHGIAAAGVVIAHTYPYNPVYQALVFGDNGPADAGVTNHFFQEHYVRLDMEVCGQGKHREDAAASALTRVDWEIATQEVVIGIGAIRAFNAVVYRKRKLSVLEETVRLGEKTVEQTRRLLEAGRARPVDLILARTDVDAARAQLGQGRTALAVAWGDLRRALGALDGPCAVEGAIGVAPPSADPAALCSAALHHRPDVQARQAAVAEADARWRLECANRYGNPSFGPAMEYNETKVTFVGLIFQAPLPVLNRRCGEIQQRDAERARAQQELAELEVQAQQDVQVALARLSNALGWADSYTREVLPNLTRSRQEMEKLFASGEAGTDVLRLLDVQRRSLKAEDSAIDALYEVSQATADLAAAVGDPTLAVPGAAPTALPHAPPPAAAPSH